MSEFTKAFYELHKWFAENDIPTESLTFIFNITDHRAAKNLELALLRHFEKLSLGQLEKSAVSTFRVYDIEVRVESPLT